MFDVTGGMSIPPPSAATVTVMPSGLKTDEHARTFMGDNAPAPAAAAVVERRAAEREHLEMKGREAKLARPTIVLLTPIAAAWIFMIVVAAAPGGIRAYKGQEAEVSETELGLMILFSGIAFITPFIVWVVHLVKNVWRNSVRALELAADMRRFLAGSLIGYGFAAVVVRIGYTVIFRDAKTVLSGWWDPLFLLFAVFGGAFGAGIGPLVRLRRRLLNA